MTFKERDNDIENIKIWQRKERGTRGDVTFIILTHK